MSKLTIEELLETVEKSETRRILSDVSDNFDILQFVHELNLEPGEENVKGVLLYDVYKKWSKAPVTHSFFTMQLKLHFDFEGINSPFFKLNITAINLSKAAIEMFLKEKRKSTVVIGQKIHFEAFLKAHEITEGDVSMEMYIIYYLYDKWSFDKKFNIPLSYLNLCKMLSLYFGKLKAKDQYYIKIHKNIYNHIDKQVINEIRQARQEKKQSKIKK